MRYKLYPRHLFSWKTLAAAVVLALILALLIGLAANLRGQAATSAGYSLERGQLSAGGGAAAGGGYRLSGAAAGTGAGSLAGGRYRLQGGLWTSPVNLLYLPLVFRR